MRVANPTGLGTLPAQGGLIIQLRQKTYRVAEMPGTSDVERLRARGKRMLELATRAHCEQNHDFARVLRQLAFEVLEHAREMEQTRESGIDRAAPNPRRSEFHRAKPKSTRCT
jgi:hypothetical protein